MEPLKQYSDAFGLTPAPSVYLIRFQEFPNLSGI